jgi:ABC-type glycerol-3-phosphate transport system substrate-binding protein
MTITRDALSRRDILKASAGLGLGAVSASILPTAVIGADAGSLKAESGLPVYFRGWEYRTDIVQDNVNRYNKEMNGKVDYATVTGDYPALMEKDLIAKAELDLFYANPSQAVRFLEGGWVTPVNELPAYDNIVADMYPNIRDAWTHKGKLLGLSYFISVRGTMVVNLDKYNKAGFDERDYPKNWSELYALLYKLRDKGEKQPFLPHWFNEWFGIAWGYALEVMNRGGTVADPETHKPMLTVDGPAGATLNDWKKIWKDGFVPEELLSYNEASYIGAFRSGRYVISPQQIYDIKQFNDPQKSPQIAGKTAFLPYQGQSWGMIDSAIYMMTSRKRPADQTEDLKRFASWYGYKDQNGECFVGNRWMKESMLFSAYKEVMEGPQAAASIKSSLVKPTDYEKLLEVYQHTPYPKGIFNVVWAEEYNSWMKEKLFAFFLKDLAVADVINDTNEKISQLNKKYKLG